MIDRDRDDVALARDGLPKASPAEILVAILVVIVALLAAVDSAFGREPDALDPLPVWGVYVCPPTGGGACRFTTTAAELDRETCLPIARAEHARRENRAASVRCLVDDHALDRIAPRAPNILPVSGISRARR